MFSDCQISTPGKWILTGEHAVLRGKSAIAFPLKSRRFILDYQVKNTPLDIHFSGGMSNHLIQSFWQGMDRALMRLQLSRHDLGGHFIASNQIPVGSGMGASAALSVTLARWFVQQKKLQPEHISAFATDIEHLYHGKSSGLDIAGVQSKSGIIFSQGHSRPLQIGWQPNFALSYCEEVGNTAKCIEKVHEVQKNNPGRALEIDEQMQRSCELAEQALQETQEAGLNKLLEAMILGLQCFEQWGLISNKMTAHIETLRQRGALAVKPTGSGNGGYVISLWSNAVPADLHPVSIEISGALIEER